MSSSYKISSSFRLSNIHLRVLYVDTQYSVFVLIRLADVFSRHMKLILSSFFTVGLLGAVAFSIETGCYIPVNKGSIINYNFNYKTNNIQSCNPILLVCYITKLRNLKNERNSTDTQKKCLVAALSVPRNVPIKQNALLR